MPRTDPITDVRAALRTNLVVLRAQRGLSQAELSKRSGVSRTVISELEQGVGDARLTTLARLAAVLETGVSNLIEPWRPTADTTAVLPHRARDDDFIDADQLHRARNRLHEHPWDGPGRIEA